MKQRQRWALNKLVKIPSYHIPPKSEKYIWISDQISCCQDAGHAGGIEAGGQQPGGGLSNLVKDYFSSHALQVNYSNLRTSSIISTPSQSLILCPRFSHPPCKPACPAGFCLADNTIQ